MNTLLKTAIVVTLVSVLASCAPLHVIQLQYDGYNVVQQDCNSSAPLEVQVRTDTVESLRLYCVVRNVSSQVLYVHLDKTTIVVDGIVRYQPAANPDPNVSTTSSRTSRSGASLSSLNTNNRYGIGYRSLESTNTFVDVADQVAVTSVPPRQVVLYPGLAVELDLRDYITDVLYAGRYMQDSSVISGSKKSAQKTRLVRLTRYLESSDRARNYVQDLVKIFDMEAARSHQLVVHYSTSEAGEGSFTRCSFRPESVKLSSKVVGNPYP
jgi:hypothetical protein